MLARPVGAPGRRAGDVEDPRDSTPRLFIPRPHRHAGMLSGASREAAVGRRARVPCRFCGQMVDLTRMRGHLREAHQLGSAELESSFLDARRTARRAVRALRR